MSQAPNRRSSGLVWFLIALTLAVGFSFRVVGKAIARQEVRVDPNFGNPPPIPPVDESGTAQIAGMKVSYWKPDLSQNRPVPLVVFSHGFHGSGTQSKFLMKDLAAHGYMVVAPNHRDAGFGGRPEENFKTVDAWTDATYWDRAEDIRRLIAGMKADAIWNAEVDWSKVALAGHSLGGYTVLGLAGAWPSWKMSGIKAVLALSPYCSPFTSKQTLGGVSVPVMYQGGTRDFGITPFVKGPGGAYDQTPSPAYFVELQGAGHLAWTDLNPRFQSDISGYAVAFLDKYVKGKIGVDLATKASDVSVLWSK